MQLNTGNGISSSNANWEFSGEMVDHFDTHIANSVPLYHEGHDLVHKISDFFISNHSVCYDIGSSTAKLLSGLAKRHSCKDAKFIGIEIEKDMHQKALERTEKIPSIQLINENIFDLELEKSDFIVCYYTMQFIKPNIRQDLFNKLYEALNWGGALVLFEKVRANDARFQDICVSLYNDFKLDHGFSPSEIMAKSQSLKGVLEPFSTQGNLDLLKRAGFKDILSIMKYVSFEGFLAIK
jgi:tRNA (cmo5U34)-methyltransferase